MLGFDDHFYVLGFPCDQFGGQEPGDEATIDVRLFELLHLLHRFHLHCDSHR